MSPDLYSGFMLSIDRVAAILALLTVVASGLASFCPPPEKAGMPCCDRRARCAFGIGASSCCTASPSTPFGPWPAVQARSLPPAARTAGQAVLGAYDPENALSRPVARRVAGTWHPPGRDGSVPLFILNASILR